VAVANRNAFYYVLDRASGEFVSGRAYAKQTWAKGLDDNGRPMVIPNTEPSEAGTLVWPNLNGATVWFSPAYSPPLSLFYVAVRELGAIYYKREAEYKPGTFFAGGGQGDIPNGEYSGAIRALEPTTGEIRWEFKMHSAPWAGVLLPRAAWCSAAPTKVISSPSTHAQASGSGIFRPAAKSRRIPFRLPSTAAR
jgi:alcohol dehydrogenase (cytochrome c)